MFPISSFGKLIFGSYAEGCVIYNANVVTEDIMRKNNVVRSEERTCSNVLRQCIIFVLLQHEKEM